MLRILQTTILFFAWQFITSPLTIQATVHRIPAGVNGIAQAASIAAPNDTLMLISPGGRYHETNQISLHSNTLTIMADPANKDKPTWTTGDKRLLRTFQNTTIQGIVLDGQNTTEFAISNRAKQPNEIHITDCIFENFTKDVITDNNQPIAFCEVKNSIFRNIGATALAFRTQDSCRELSVENCTFYNIGEQAINISEDKFPIRAHIQNVTIYGSTGGIFFNNISFGEIRQSIITNCRVYGIRADKPTILTHICTYGNWENFDGLSAGTECFQQDPLFFKPHEGDLSLLPNSPALDRAGQILGDLHWTGEATLRAGRQHWIDFTLRWFGICVLLLGSGSALVWLIRYQVRQQERLKSGAALRESEAKYRDLFDAAHDIILIANQRGYIQDINQRGETVTGYNRQALLKMNLITDLTIEEHQPIIREALQKAVFGADSIFEVQWLKANGERADLEGATTSRMTPTGDFAAARCIFRDITERRQIERELIRVERLQSLGEMSAGVSHNLNNILSGILLPAEMLKRSITNPESLDYINTIHKSGRRAADLVSRLHTSVRGEDQIITSVDVNDIIKEAIKVTSPRWKDQAEAEKRNIAIDTDLNDVPLIRGSETGLLEMITNLIRNAVDAMPKGGTITIRSELIAYRVGISIQDTGIGMDEQTRSRVFEPFFTTKVDVGTGLGLSTVYGTITRWGGYISVQSAPDKGTTFKMELPLWLEKAKKIPKYDTGEIKEGRRRFLIVDDEELVRTTLRQAITQNHDVITCNNGASAIAHIRSSHFDVALIDYGLPEQRGDAVAQALKAKDANLVTVLITGWQLEHDDPGLTLFDFHIKKPFASSTAINNILSQALVLHDQRQANANLSSPR